MVFELSYVWWPTLLCICPGAPRKVTGLLIGLLKENFYGTFYSNRQAGM
jgi:hypothetical protein